MKNVKNAGLWHAYFASVYACIHCVDLPPGHVGRVQKGSEGFRLALNLVLSPSNMRTQKQNCQRRKA